MPTEKIMPPEGLNAVKMVVLFQRMQEELPGEIETLRPHLVFEAGAGDLEHVAALLVALVWLFEQSYDPLQAARMFDCLHELPSEFLAEASIHHLEEILIQVSPAVDPTPVLTFLGRHRPDRRVH